jgi:hypothetical protein
VNVELAGITTLIGVNDVFAGIEIVTFADAATDVNLR